MIALEHMPYRIGMVMGIKVAPFCHRAEAYYAARFDGGILATGSIPLFRALLTEAAPIDGALGEEIAGLGEAFEEAGELCVIGRTPKGRPFLFFGERHDVLSTLRDQLASAFETLAASPDRSAAERYEAAQGAARLRNERPRPMLRAVG